MDILIVEDDELNQRMLEIMLSGKGYVIQFASNGLEALEVVKSSKFDLILMDLMMPLMDGFETCRRIREWEAGKLHIPIVALTAYSMQREAQRCFEVGMDDYMSKPLQVNRLLQLIEFLVNKNKKQTAPLTTPTIDKGQVEIPVLDIERALPIFGNDMALLKELFGDFIRSLPEKLSQLRDELDSGDLKTLSIHAHNLKGLSANFGAMQLSGQASALDMHCRDGNRALAADTLLDLSNTVDMLRAKAFEILEPPNKSPHKM
jgi:two-component system, sensor histidine kinase and response regulator